MKFEPKTEAQVSGLFEEGIYKYEVSECEDKVSGTGKNMLYMNIKIFSDDGRAKFVKDYLINNYKLRHFCYSNGLDEQYEKGEITPQMTLKRKGYAEVIIQKDPEKKWPDKNKISDYIVKDEQTIANPINNLASARSESLASISSDLNDDVPF